MAVSGAWGRLVAVCVFATLLVAATSESAFSQIALKLVATGFSEPLAFVQDPTNPSVQFVVQKGGRIRVLLNGALQATDFLNLTGTVSTISERGLLGLAFSPDYADSRRFFVNFTNLQGHTVIARFERSAGNALVADAGSRFDLRWPGGQRFIVQPFANHNGGTLRFGPDGYLYIGMGDGGSGNDPNNTAQTPTTLLGKMLRIDVSVADNDDDGYRVPPDNPFVDSIPIPALHEIWAFGLRNPWKFSFDDPARGGTGGLFIGDVGQSAREEISFAPAGIGARNFGWRIREGTIAGSALPVLPAAYTPLTNPIHDYPRTVGQSVTGGVVYRGTQLSGTFIGRYFFGDFIAGRIFSLGLTYNGGEATVTNVLEHTAELGGASTIGNVSSIDVDASGEIIITDFRGSVRRIVPAEPLMLTMSGTGTVAFAPTVPACTGSCTRWLARGTVLNLLPTTPTSWAFGGWGGSPDCLDGVVTLSAATSCTATFLPRLASPPTAPRVDLNGDGRSDVFTYGAATGVWRSELSGVAGPAGAVQGLWAPQWTIRPADFNADGLTDLLLYNSTTGQWFKATRTPSGGFTYYTAVWPAGLESYVLDLSGDGRTDVFLYDRSSGQWSKCLTVGAANFSCSTGLWGRHWQLFPAALDGNTRADLLLYETTTGRWAWALSDSGPGWTYRYGAWALGWTVHPGDFNGDLRSDVFLYNQTTGAWFLGTNTGTGYTYTTGLWAKSWTVRIGDIDGNGRADVFLYNATTGQWFQCVTTSAGFVYTTGVWAPGWQVHLADLDGNRRADVVLYNPISGQWFRCLNTGAGLFQYTTGVWQLGLTVIASP
jgi:glucose/arabinose dehydrogenase